MICFGTGALERSLAAYEVFHNQERNHQGVVNALIAPRGPSVAATVPSESVSASAMLRYYYRRAG